MAICVWDALVVVAAMGRDAVYGFFFFEKCATLGGINEKRWQQIWNIRRADWRLKVLHAPKLPDGAKSVRAPNAVIRGYQRNPFDQCGSSDDPIGGIIRIGGGK